MEFYHQLVTIRMQINEVLRTIKINFNHIEF